MTIVKISVKIVFFLLVLIFGVSYDSSEYLATSGRRLRATARLLWWQIRTKRRVAKPSLLRWILRTLQRHHSFDQAFLAKISLALRQAAMAHQNAGWWCIWRRKDVKASFNHCGFCGASWQDCQSAGTRPKSPRKNSRRRNQNWNYTGDWQSVWPRTGQPKPKSPRKKAMKSPARPHPKERTGSKKFVLAWTTSPVQTRPSKLNTSAHIIKMSKRH
eukprot:s279_g22.t1